ncbi:TonB family protein [Pollutibacter soli]|uniref:TonB family protein n=1 Tax=Pollutibacter soli TaxID=3034157 RepID=UPI00301322F7
MRGRIISCVLLFTLQQSVAQNDTTIRFLNSQYQQAEETGARYKTRMVKTKTPDGNWSVNDYYFENRKLMIRSFFSDSTMTNATGVYEVFDSKGNKLISGNYVNNNKNGAWKYWHNNGRINDSVVYENGNIVGIRKGFYNDGTLRDSAFYNKNGNGNQISWHTNGAKRSEGQLVNSAKTGQWKFYFKSGKIAAEQLYATDSVVSMRCFDEEGNIVNDDCVDEKLAQFPNGMDGWRKYITKKVSAYRKQLKQEGRPGTVYVSFIVGVDGKVEDAKVEDPKGIYLEDFALQIILTSPQWTPARQHNLPVRSYYRQPITFKLGN